MSKSTNFSGQPIFSQIIKLIPREKVQEASRELATDKYYKKFKTYDHLVVMLYAILNRCTSIREVITGFMACEDKLNHLGINGLPRRSTLSEANCKRDYKVFEVVYNMLYEKYARSLPDSQSDKLLSKLYICDSTTIALFQEILKNAGRKPMDGKRKGGIKAHTLIKADEDVPCLVQFTAGAAHDNPFLKKLDIPSGSIIVFDRGYNNYEVFSRWTEQNVTFVTRLRKKAVYEVLEEKELSNDQKETGVLSDKLIILGHSSHKNVTKVQARMVEFYDKENDRNFTFITNNFGFEARTIADIYKKRWQIESLFKRIKQNYPLKYFLGDNENALKIQIWCALIADLLLKYIKRQVKRSWAFSNLSSMIRLHSMSYINIFKFLENPEKAINEEINRRKVITLSLFET
jgi:hypothetical protein